MWTAAPVIGQVFVQVADGKHTSELSFEDRKNMPEDEHQDWAYGSQIFLLGLTGYFVIIWMLKFNMLCFYSRVVRTLWTEKFVKPLMIFVVASGVAILLTLALTCRPFENLWQVWPDPGRMFILFSRTPFFFFHFSQYFSTMANSWTNSQLRTAESRLLCGDFSLQLIH